MTRAREDGLVRLGGHPKTASSQNGSVEGGVVDTGERRYWRSLDRLQDSPALAADGALPEELRPEFAVGADLPPDGVTRRTMLGLMGASLGMAGLAGCRRPEEAIVPYVRAPENVTPGLARHYASAFALAGDVLGVVVESHEGRPTKIEGNPNHPASGGAANAWAQASVLHLYDPDRLPAPQLRRRDKLAMDEAGEWVPVTGEGGGASGGGEVEAADSDSGHGSSGSRVPHARHGASPSSWGDFAAFWQTRAEGIGGDGGRLAVLAGTHASPSLTRAAGNLARRFPGLRWVGWDAAGDANAWDGLAGRRPLHDLERARVILALDCDLFLTEAGAVAAARGFARGRRVEEAGADGSGDPLSRLYVVEPMPTVTGGSADHRLRLKASQVGAFARAVAAELGAGGAGGAADDSELPPDPLPQLALDAVPVVATDLRRAGSAALVAVGRRQPPEVHALARSLNQALGSVGTTVTYGDLPDGAAADSGAALVDLATAMRGGEIDTLVILGGNPVYSAPVDLELPRALERVPHVVYLAHGWDETGYHADWLLPEASWLESWGDARAADGTAALIQPLVAPLFDARSSLEVVAMMASGEERSGYELVREAWLGAVGGEAGWRRALHEGVLPASAVGAVGSGLAVVGAVTSGDSEPGAVIPDGSDAAAGEAGGDGSATTADPAATRDATSPVAGVVPGAADPASSDPADGAPADTDTSAIAAVNTGSADAASDDHGDSEHGDSDPGDGGHGPAAPRGTGWAADPGAERGSPAARQPQRNLELIYSLSPSVFDGRFANVSWLQEMPDPVTKVTWANPALVSPATAEDLGLADGDIAVLAVDGRAVRLPVVVQAGAADGTVAVELGYGRHGAGRVGDGVGVDVGQLRTSAAPWIAHGASLDPDGDQFELARTQEHQSMEGRHLVREADLDQYREDQRFAERYEVDVEVRTNLWEKPDYDGPHQWGMTIDLGACTGCNACVIACQSENNIPVVGPDQVRKGRELHWLRVDRYFEGDGDEARPVFQPVPCMHCENAPCEQVCPVAATVHDEEGLNAMVYNRCIGTRYCSNNCPYKVRRFNYFNFTRDTPELVKAAMNPDVTVRSRGVMEKCTYCLQRINEGKAVAKRARRRVADGEIKTACQQTCPTEAISFGDLTDADSGVSRAKRSPRNYVLLAELNNHPRTSYLARVRNPNPEWPGYAAVPLPPARPAGEGHGEGDGDGHGGDEHGTAEEGTAETAH